MNSKQRRLEKRALPYTIMVPCHVHERYMDHDQRVKDASVWCRKNAKGNWKFVNSWDYAKFQFSKERDAVLFALKWI